MQIANYTIEEFFKAFPNAVTPFSGEAFTRLNAQKPDAIGCFAGLDEKGSPRLGLVAGMDKEKCEWLCPFSAPFGEVAWNKPQSLERIADFFVSLRDHLAPAKLRITLAPPYYDTLMLPKLAGVAARLCRSQIYDFDYFYPLERTTNFQGHSSTTARQKFRRASKEDFSFDPSASLPRAYAVIRANRDCHGYRLAMSLEQMEATSKIIGVDSMVLSLDGIDVAAAIVYRLTPAIAQVIYWGDIPGHSDKRPMNLLPYHVFSHYASLGFSTVDVGPASTDGIPNQGLCEFKESIGCLTSLKPTFVL